jgi:hypothetical protein
MNEILWLTDACDARDQAARRRAGSKGVCAHRRIAVSRINESSKASARTEGGVAQPHPAFPLATRSEAKSGRSAKLSTAYPRVCASSLRRTSTSWRSPDRPRSLLSRPSGGLRQMDSGR